MIAASHAGLTLAVPHVSRDGAASDGQRERSGRTIGIALFGCTGSVGTQAIDVIEHLGDPYTIVALVGNRNYDMLSQQVARHRPSIVGFDQTESALPDTLRMYPGRLSPSDAMRAAALSSDVDMIIAASAGHAAIEATLIAIGERKAIALANKETIVCAGPLVVAAAQASGAELRPVDSEHSAIWQSLGLSSGADIERLILTASGGPFRETPAEQLRQVTAAAALRHPTWAMGGKITVDSATMMNKGLEIIETHWLFGVPYDRISVVVHPQSIIHSLVEFADGSQVAQLSNPDMRLPIQYAITYPEHRPGRTKRLSLTEIDSLTFTEPDFARFPALRIAREAGEAGSTYPTVLSAADEVAVSAFLDERTGFTDISEIVEETLSLHDAPSAISLDAIFAVDEWARRTASLLVSQRTRNRGN